MKRTVIAVVLLVMTIGFSMFSHYSINRRIDEIVRVLEDDREITISTSSPDGIRTKQVKEIWKKNEKFLVATLAHGELEEIEIGIMCLSDYMTQGYTEEYIKTLNECINQLHHIKETEKADTKNIF